uniref:Putative ovule protein n=1 Tax=Solanum chacoense TaxID=4108 RepID=A0A0V0GMW4_SOLCH
MMNRVGDRGSPCFKPLDDLKKPYDCPFTNIEYQLLDISLHTISIKNSEKPNFRSTLNQENP